MGLDVFWVFALLGLACGFIGYVIAADRLRFLVRFELDQWRESYYLRSLPNFLQALHDHHFRSAWPVKCNALSAAFFRFRARPLLCRKPAHLRRAFLQQHTILFALREILKPYLRDFFLQEQARLIGNRIIAMEDTIDRERLIAYLENLKAHRAAFQESLTSYDRGILREMTYRQFIPTLRRAHAIFQEHGYSLLSELSELRRWQELTGVELVQELPVLPILRRPRLKVGSGSS